MASKPLLHHPEGAFFIVSKTSEAIDMQLYPILEHDSSLPAIIEPSRVLSAHKAMPDHVVFCFFHDAIQSLCGDDKAGIITHLGSEMGDNPIYCYSHQGKNVAIIHPGVGAPLAGGFFEETIALGGKKFIACGGAGALDAHVGLGHVIIPASAIRDEGTSYHYLPPSREVDAHPEAIKAIVATLEKHDVPHDIGKTWTTDGIYRETPAKVKMRREEGALTVEMEAAAFFAIAQFRGVIFGQMLYGGDNLAAEDWDNRGWQKQYSLREKLLLLAIESVLSL
jgi:uridine phosphorylase